MATKHTYIPVGTGLLSSILCEQKSHVISVSYAYSPWPSMATKHAYIPVGTGLLFPTKPKYLLSCKQKKTSIYKYARDNNNNLLRN